MDYKVNRKENAYFVVKVVFTAIFWLVLIGICASLGEEGPLAGATAGVIAVYAACIALFLFFQKIFIVAFLKGDGICVSEAQFPDVYRRYAGMAEKLGLKKIPPLFVIQQGGALNAFAIRFSRRNYIAIYSDVFAVYESDPDALDFVLGHELGHVRRHHMSKAFWTIPASLIPFLGAAWSRACEYTCDNVGAFLTGTAKTSGLLLLAGGGDLYRKIDVPRYLETARFHRTAVVRFVGLFMSHPWLPARIESLNAQYR